jgi:hypothetical protein
MRLTLSVLLYLAVACASGPQSRIVSTPQGSGPALNCPYAPVGDSAFVRLTVVSQLGDTLRTAQVRLAGRTMKGPAKPVELKAPAASDVYELGPFPVGDYTLTVEDSGWRPAHIQVRFCSNDTATLRAIMVPIAP